MATAATRYTPDDLLRMKNGATFELIDGQLVEKPMGARSSRVAQILNRHIDNHATAMKLGLVFPPDAGYQIFADDLDKVRKPDGSFIRSGRLPGDVPPEGYLRIHPNLAIEVVSPHDLAEEIAARVKAFLEAGVELMWVVYPASRHVEVYRQNGNDTHLGIGDLLHGEGVLPGFSLPVAELFANLP